MAVLPPRPPARAAGGGAGSLVGRFWSSEAPQPAPSWASGTAALQAPCPGICAQQPGLGGTSGAVALGQPKSGRGRALWEGGAPPGGRSLALACSGGALCFQEAGSSPVWEAWLCRSPRGSAGGERPAAGGPPVSAGSRKAVQRHGQFQERPRGSPGPPGHGEKWLSCARGPGPGAGCLAQLSTGRHPERPRRPEPRKCQRVTGRRQTAQRRPEVGREAELCPEPRPQARGTAGVMPLTLAGVQGGEARSCSGTSGPVTAPASLQATRLRHRTAPRGRRRR